VPSLDALVASEIEVDAVVTNPDRPAGRGLELQSSPVKQAALRYGLEVVQPRRARDEDFLAWFRERAPDVATVVAYGKILPAEVLEIPRLGFVNVHFSLLPAYRGAAPVQRALMNGDETTGVSIMVLTEGMDEGPVLTRTGTAIGPEETAGTLGERLAHAGAPLLVRSLLALASGEISPEPQDDTKATYAPKITNEEAFIDWSLPAARIHNHVRALDPAPGASTLLGTRLLKVWSVTIRPDLERLDPGELHVIAGDMAVGTGDDAVSVNELQPAGKRRMAGPDFARGLRLTGGERLGGQG